MRRCTLLLLAALVVARALPAQSCEVRVTRTAPHDVDGAVIRSVVVRTEAPLTLPIAGEQLAALRRTTETRVVRRQLLFEPGERVDTIRVAETLRRLRAQRLYSDVSLEVRHCAGVDSVDMVVSTRDAFTLRPVVRLVPPNTVSLGFEDRNVLGTSQSLSVANEQTMQGHGGSVAYTDPWVLGTDVAAGMRFADVAGNHFLRAFVRHHERSEFDPWRVEASIVRQSFSGVRQPVAYGHSLYVAAEVGHVVGGSRLSIIVPYVGIVVDSAKLGVPSGAGGIDTTQPPRRFVGVELGLLRRTMRFDTLTWFVPQRGFLDIPLSFEWDAQIAPGRDRARGLTVAHYDGWFGRMWMPRRGLLLASDFWTSGFLGPVRKNHIDRVALAGYDEAPRGYWGAKVMLEQLASLDADQHFLSQANITSDPSLPAVPQAFRTANRSLSASLERAMHLHYFGRGTMLDIAAFGAGSMRWDTPGLPDSTLALGVVGARLRLLQANGVIASARVDVSYPVAATGAVVRRALVSISISPFVDFARQRDGRRRL